MAYSQEVIQIVKDKVSLIPTSVLLPVVPEFHTKEMWDFNQLTDATYPLVILDRPLDEESKIMMQGNPQKIYRLFIYIFAGCVDVNADHATYKEPLLIIAEEIKDKLIKLLSDAVGATGRISNIVGYKSTEIPETRKNDNNPVGLLLQLPIVYTSLKSIC